jgi:alpha-1,2-glucosyltransferase
MRPMRTNPELKFHRYIFSTLYAKFSTYAKCSPAILRSFNVFALIMTFSYACDCRALISRTRSRGAPGLRNASVAFRMQNWAYASQRISPDELHTALNIALFPLLFFFSGLFYTDVLSTCVVLRVYRLFLERRGAYQNSSEGLFWLYLTGIVALWMRQTNIFWVAVFMGALEVVRTIDTNQTPNPVPEDMPYGWKNICVFYFKRYSRGQIHDVPLKDAGVHGMTFLLGRVAPR